MSPEVAEQAEICFRPSKPFRPRPEFPFEIEAVRQSSPTASPVRLCAWVLGLSLLAIPHAAAQSPTTTYVPHDWPLKPSEVSLGVPFRLVFLTSTKHDATSSEASVYSTFVQTAAKSGHASIRTHADKFEALVSTSGVTASGHTGTNGSTEPMYWLLGTKAGTFFVPLPSPSHSSRVNVGARGGGDVAT